MNYKTNIICDYGSYRSVDPEHTLPQLAWRLDTSLPILGWEILVRVECINLNSASFNQIKLESNDEPFKVIQRIQNIVATRGKMHNPVTGSGGTLSGIVEQVGSEHPDFGKTFVGERICTLFSLSTTPLIIESVKSINMRTGQLDIDGHAILFPSSLYARIPDWCPAKLCVSAFGDAGSTYETYRLCKPGMNVLIVGAYETVGMLCLAAARNKIGKSGHIVAVLTGQKKLSSVRGLEMADEILIEELEDPFRAYKDAKEKLNNMSIDLTIDCTCIQGSEMFGVLMTKQNGSVYYTSPAANYSAAALGTEGVGKELDLQLYRGYINGHVAFCIKLLEENPKLVQVLCERYEDQSQVFYLNAVQQGELAEIPGIELVIKDTGMKNILELAKRIAIYDTSVIIYGETGTGKELVADIVNRYSHRFGKPYLKINCSAIPENLIEAELFGYESGSFTGALKTGHKGFFEIADNGTLFLDEIGEIPIAEQAKLLRVLQSREIIRVGGTKPIPVDVRIICATNRNLWKMVEEGSFREDLYYRLNVIDIMVPALRNRKESIPDLADMFLRRYNGKFGMHKRFSDHALEMLLAYNWPGNVREMENMIQRLLLATDENVITQQMLVREFGKTGYKSKEIQERWIWNLDNKQQVHEENESNVRQKRLIPEEEFRKAALHCSSTRELATTLGISQTTASRRLKTLGIVLKNPWTNKRTE